MGKKEKFLKKGENFLEKDKFFGTDKFLELFGTDKFLELINLPLFTGIDFYRWFLPRCIANLFRV